MPVWGTYVGNNWDEAARAGLAVRAGSWVAAGCEPAVQAENSAAVPTTPAAAVCRKNLRRLITLAPPEL